MFVFIFAWGYLSFAGPLIVPKPDCPSPSIYQNVNFIPVETIDQFVGIEKSKQAVKANFSYKSLNPNDPKGCSGFFSSNAGHLVTLLFETCSPEEKFKNARF